MTAPVHLTLLSTWHGLAMLMQLLYDLVAKWTHHSCMHAVLQACKIKQAPASHI